MSHVVDDIVNPIGAITGIDPVKQATGFTGTGFDKKPQASSQVSNQQASVSSGGSRPTSSMSTMLSQLANQQVQQPVQPQFSPAQVPQSGIGFGQQLYQLNNPAAMQSAINVAGSTMNKWFGQ